MYVKVIHECHRTGQEHRTRALKHGFVDSFDGLSDVGATRIDALYVCPGCGRRHLKYDHYGGAVPDIIEVDENTAFEIVREDDEIGVDEKRESGHIMSSGE